jgi:hypothetical protein
MSDAAKNPLDSRSVPVAALGNREQVPSQVVGRIAGLLQRASDHQPVRVTLTAPGPGALRALVEQVQAVARAVWLVEAADRRGRTHVHGVALVEPQGLRALETLAALGPQRFDLISGWPGHPQNLARSLRDIVAYDLKTGKHAPTDESPVRAWGTASLAPAGVTAHAFILARADSWGRTCACGCGRPLGPGRRKWASDACAERGRKRAQRKPSAPPSTPGSPSLSELRELAARLTAGLELYAQTTGNKS